MVGTAHEKYMDKLHTGGSSETIIAATRVSSLTHNKVNCSNKNNNKLSKNFDERPHRRLVTHRGGE